MEIFERHGKVLYTEDNSGLGICEKSLCLKCLRFGDYCKILTWHDYMCIDHGIKAPIMACHMFLYPELPKPGPGDCDD